MNHSHLKGSWTYRSFHDDPNLVDSDPEKALALFFAEGTLTVTSAEDGVLKGTLSWSGKVQMHLAGRFYEPEGLAPAVLLLTGIGIDDIDTQGWVYQYQGYLVPAWPGGMEQRPAMVGSVTRTIRHGTSPAGYVASFIMVRQ